MLLQHPQMSNSARTKPYETYPDCGHNFVEKTNNQLKVLQGLQRVAKKKWPSFGPFLDTVRAILANFLHSLPQEEIHLLWRPDSQIQVI